MAGVCVWLVCVAGVCVWLVCVRLHLERQAKGVLGVEEGREETPELEVVHDPTPVPRQPRGRRRQHAAVANQAERAEGGEVAGGHASLEDGGAAWSGGLACNPAHRQQLPHQATPAHKLQQHAHRQGRPARPSWKLSLKLV